MEDIFEVKDKTGRKIRLTREQWNHIKTEHPEIEKEEVQLAIEKPIKIIEKTNNKYSYYQYLKYKKLPFRFLRVIVKYLNGEGFIITSYFVKRIS